MTQPVQTHGDVVGSWNDHLKRCDLSGKIGLPVDLLKALSTWVENGTPPSRQNLVLTKQDKSGEPAMTRPMCKFPAWPRYKGAGDVNAASSFECSME